MHYQQHLIRSMNGRYSLFIIYYKSFAIFIFDQHPQTTLKNNPGPVGYRGMIQ